MARTIREIPWLDTREGTYYACWYDKQSRRTKRLSLRTSDAGEAQSRFAAFLTEGEIREVRLSGLTVPEVLDKYLEQHVAVNSADARRQRDAAKHLNVFFDGKPIADVNAQNTRTYRELREKGVVSGSRHKGEVSPMTVRRELNVLVAAANHCAKWGWIAKTDVPMVDLPTEAHTTEGEEVKFLTRAEIDILMGMADGDLHDFIVLAYFTGSRRAAIEELTVEQVRLNEKRLYLLPQGAKQTKKRRPVVPIFPEMAPVLERRIAGRKTGPIFPATFDAYRPFSELCKACGFDGRHNPHILRHSRATHLLQGGKWTIWQVAKLLGDTVATIERRYGHHQPEFLPEEI